MYNSKEVLESELEKYENDYYTLKSHIDNDDKELKDLQVKKDNNLLLIDELKSNIYNNELELIKSLRKNQKISLVKKFNTISSKIK